MRLVLLAFLFIGITFSANAETIKLVSTQYVADNCVVKSGTWSEQTLTGNYTVSGTLSVPTPPLPPEQ